MTFLISYFIQFISFSPEHFCSESFPHKSWTYQILRGTLNEMIKNEANKAVKLTTSATPPTTTTPASIHQQSNVLKNEDEKRTIFIQKMNQQKSSDDDNVKPLSKIDIIKKFDNKYKTEKNDEIATKVQPPVARIAPATVKHDKFLINDNLENEENFNNRKTKKIFDDVNTEEKSTKEANDNDNGNSDDDYINDEIRQDSSEPRSPLSSNNFHKNGCSDNGSSITSTAGVIPPKPLPRTSRNNSISSDQGSVQVSTSDDSMGSDKMIRPVAKPRTTSTSYKVHIIQVMQQKNCNLFHFNLSTHLFGVQKSNLWCLLFSFFFIILF